MFDVCDRARGFQSTTAGLAFSRRTCCINSLANFLHCNPLPVFQGLCGHYRLCSVTFLTQRLHPHFVGQRHLSHISSVLERVLYKKLSKFINKELAILLFTNTTSQVTSLTVNWLLVILNHWKNLEWFLCTGFHTKFLSALKSLGGNTVTLAHYKLFTCWYGCYVHMRGRMHDADVSASLRLKLTYDGLAH